MRRPVPVRTLSRRQPHPFDLSPEGDEAGAIARFLGLEALRALRFRGELAPSGDGGWRIEAVLSAEVVQACVATLEPVAQRIEETVVRDYVPEDEYRPPAEIDIDPDAEDEPDPFGTVIDPGLLAVESLSLVLDPYPRAPGVPPADYLATPPGGRAAGRGRPETLCQAGRSEGQARWREGLTRGCRKKLPSRRKRVWSAPRFKQVRSTARRSGRLAWRCAWRAGATEDAGAIGREEVSHGCPAEPQDAQQARHAALA